MATIAPFIATFGESATLRTRSLGARDIGYTNWPEETYVGTTIKVMIKELQTREVDTSAGRVTEKRLAFYSTILMGAMDELEYPAGSGEIFEIESVGTPHYLLGSVGYYNYVGVLRT